MSAPKNRYRVRQDEDGCPLVTNAEQSSSNKLVEAIWDEDVDSVASILDANPGLADSMLRHYALNFEQWTYMNQSDPKHRRVDWDPKQPQFAIPRTEPAVLFASLVPVYKQPHVEARQVSEAVVAIIQLLVNHDGTLNHEIQSRKLDEGFPAGHSYIDVALIRVCREYDSPAITEALIRAGADPKSPMQSYKFCIATDGYFSDLMVETSRAGSTGSLAVLLDHGMPYLRGDVGMSRPVNSPLHFAARWGREEVVRLLVERAEALGVKQLALEACLGNIVFPPVPQLGTTVLMSAVHFYTVGLKYQHKNHQAWCRDERLLTRENIVHYLLDAGADAKAEDETDGGILQSACVWAGSSIISRIIMEGDTSAGKCFKYPPDNGYGRLNDPGPFARGSDQATYFHVAAGACNAQAIQSLHEHGALISVDEFSRTPLHWVPLAFWESYGPEQVGREKLELSPGSPLCTTAASLLDIGAAVNHQDCFGRTALHYACKLKLSNLICLLLTKGADASLADFEGRTALHYLADVHPKSRFGEYEYLDAAKLLDILSTQRPLLIDHPDQQGMTPLALACKNAFARTASLFLDLRANPNLIGQNGWTALHHAANRPEWQREQDGLFRLKPADRYDPADSDQLAQQLKELLLAAGADASIVNYQHQTAQDIEDSEARRLQELQAEYERERNRPIEPFQGPSRPSWCGYRRRSEEWP